MPHTPLQPGEAVVKESRANLQRGAESVGGHLYLTDRRMIFESHSFNVKLGATEIAVSDITAMRKVWTKFLGVIPLVPNSIAISTADGAEHRVVCSRRDEWIDAVRSVGGGVG